MKVFIISLLILSSIFCYAEDQTGVAEIMQHLKQSEEATTKTLRGDKAIFHTTLAESLYNELELNNLELEEEIQLKFIGAFRLVNQPQNARKHLKRLLYLIVKNNNYASRKYFLNAGRLATDYMNIGELDSAKKYFLSAHESASQVGETLYIASTLNNLGILAEKDKKLEEAIKYYNDASELLIPKAKEDSIFLTSINDNKANYYLIHGDSAKGIAIMQENITFLKRKPQEYKRLTDYCFRLIEIYQQTKNWSPIDELFQLAASSLQLGKGKWKLEKQVQYHELMIEYKKHSGNLAAIIQEYKQLDSLKNLTIINTEEQRVLMNGTMSDYFLLSANQEIEREKEKAKEAKEKNDQKTFFIAFLIAIFILISLLIRSSAKRRIRAESAERKMKEQALQLKELENLKLSQDLQHTSNDFSNLMMQTSLKEDWSAELIQQLESLYKAGEAISPAQLKNVVRELRQKSGVYDKVNLQQKGMNEANTAFFDRLDKQYPELTKAERELCGLIRLRLDGKEIAVIRNIHPSSVRKLRHRLRKKLALAAEQDVYEFIAKV